MKAFLLAILTLTIAFEASAQRHGGGGHFGGGQGRGGQGPGRVGPGPGRVGPGPGHNSGSIRVNPGQGRRAPGPVVVNPGHGRRDPGPVVVNPGYGRRDPGPAYPGYGRRQPGQFVRRPVIVRNGPVVRVMPRYVRNSYSRRVLRSIVRSPIIWNVPFGYTCNVYEQLALNGQFIHDFQYQGECSQAVQDIRVYGDFCDGEDLYDQSGALEAQFTFDYECRDALGYYY